MNAGTFFFSLICFTTLAWASDMPPVVYLPFDRNFLEQGPCAFSTTNHGDLVLIDRGIKGDGLFVGGTEDWLDVAIDSRLHITNGATLEFWFARDDWKNPYKGGSGWQTIANIDGITVNITAPGCPLHIPWVLEASVGWDLAVSPEPIVPITLSFTNTIIAPRTWYHVAVVIDPQLGQTRLYVNGNIADEKPHAPPVATTFVNPLRLGTWYKANQAFRGCIDEVKVYDYPRTAEQVNRSSQR
jgi:hypothetical protein